MINNICLIIPTKDRPKELERFLHSVASQNILPKQIIIVDGGDIDADDELQNAFPDLDGSNIIFRKLSISTYGNFYDALDFKIGIDFANVGFSYPQTERAVHHALTFGIAPGVPVPVLCS